MKTHFEKTKDAAAKRKWVVVDATDQVLGRLASKIAIVLRGKNNPAYTPHTDTGDFVVVVNAEKIRLTGRKEDGKVYHHYTGYIGGLKSETAGNLRARKPEELIRRAVRGMIPVSPLGRQQLKKLKVYAGAEHPHSAQQPQEFN